MSVEINGRELVEALDVAAEAGGLHQAIDLFVADVRPRNGVVEIRFTGRDGGEAIVQAIEVVPGEQRRLRDN